jgi:hypothetical protein
LNFVHIFCLLRRKNLLITIYNYIQVLPFFVKILWYEKTGYIAAVAYFHKTGARAAAASGVNYDWKFAKRNTKIPAASHAVLQEMKLK